MTGIYPFLRPDLLRDRSGIKALYITGTLANSRPGAAYEGRLQVHNPVGAFEVISVTGDTLPPGTDVYADNGANQIVVRWPAYSESASEIPNGDFSTGTMDHWVVTKYGEQPGFPAYASVSASRPPPGQTYSAFWQGNKGTGHAGGVEAIWTNDFKGQVGPGRRVTASAQIALDDTGSSQNRGNCRISFYDSSDGLLREFTGNTIRGNDSSYRLSSVSGTAPPGTSWADVHVWTTANDSSGSGVRFGTVQWDLPDTVGINIETTLCFTVTVRDSAGRTAPWSGCVTVQDTSWDWITWEGPFAYNSVYSAGTCVYDPIRQEFHGFTGPGWKVSADRGETWTQYGTTNQFSGAVNPSTGRVVGATAATIYSSDDGGVTRTVRATKSVKDMKFLAGEFVAMTNTFLTFGAANAETWTDGNNFWTGFGSQSDFTYLDHLGRWLLIKSTGVCTYADGKASPWTAGGTISGISGNAQRIHYVARLQLAFVITTNGQIWSTPDGITFTQELSAPGLSLGNIVDIPELEAVVAVGSGASISTYRRMDGSSSWIGTTGRNTWLTMAWGANIETLVGITAHAAWRAAIA